MSTTLNERSLIVRRVRAALKWRVRSVPTTAAARGAAAEIIEAFPPDAARMWVGDLLHACRNTDRSRVQQMLAQSGIWFESKQLGELTDRQRDALCALLRKVDDAR